MADAHPPQDDGHTRRRIFRQIFRQKPLRKLTRPSGIGGRFRLPQFSWV